MLVLVGLGLWDERDLSLRGLEEARASDVVFLEQYTSRAFGASRKGLERLVGKRILPASRALVESGRVLEKAGEKKVCLLVVGDPLVATTHADLLLQCREQRIKTRIVHNASIYDALGDTGLQFYKFGRATTIPFWTERYQPASFAEVIRENLRRGLHTLVFLDLHGEEKKYMTANEAIKTLLAAGIPSEDKILVCCRMGSPSQKIFYGSLKGLANKSFGKPLHAIVVPGRLHEKESEFLKAFETRKNKQKD